LFGLQTFPKSLLFGEPRGRAVLGVGGGDLDVVVREGIQPVATADQGDPTVLAPSQSM